MSPIITPIAIRFQVINEHSLLAATDRGIKAQSFNFHAFQKENEQLRKINDKLRHHCLMTYCIKSIALLRLRVNEWRSRKVAENLKPTRGQLGPIWKSVSSYIAIKNDVKYHRGSQVGKVILFGLNIWVGESISKFKVLIFSTDVKKIEHQHKSHAYTT